MLSEAVERKITLEGYHPSLTKSDLPIVNAITKVEIDDAAILLQINEAAYLGDGHSCLSICQTEYNGFEVDDSIYFGTMSIKTKHKWGFDIPLVEKNGLSCFHIVLPTPRDLEDLQVFELTADLPWNPSTIPDRQLCQINEGRSKNIPVDVLARRLGTSNIDRVKKTLEVTTWLGKLDPRRPDIISLGFPIWVCFV